jgi:hypothetical protein
MKKEAACFSETTVSTYRLYGVITQKTTIFTFTAVETSKLELLLLSEILGFRTLSIVLVLKTNYEKHDVSETGSVFVLR